MEAVLVIVLEVSLDDDMEDDKNDLKLAESQLFYQLCWSRGASDIVRGEGGGGKGNFLETFVNKVHGRYAQKYVSQAII